MARPTQVSNTILRLRRADATIAANHGAKAHQLMGNFGWDTLKMAEAYTRAADQQRLAESAMHMLEVNETENAAIAAPDSRETS
jgi:hypothetical protein